MSLDAKFPDGQENGPAVREPDQTLAARPLPNMKTLPAICDTCGSIFASGFGGSGTFVNCKSGPCPVCGGFGSVPDGTYQTTGNVIRLLAGSRTTQHQLQAIATAVARARQSSSNATVALAELKTSAPELSTIADTLPKNRTELYAFLTLILTALGVLIAAAALWKEAAPSESEIQKMIDETIENATRAQPNQKDSRPITRTGGKTGRNEKCPCGSGKKYKKCCLLTT